MIFIPGINISSCISIIYIHSSENVDSSIKSAINQNYRKASFNLLDGMFLRCIFFSSMHNSQLVYICNTIMITMITIRISSQKYDFVLHFEHRSQFAFNYSHKSLMYCIFIILSRSNPK